MFTGNLSFSPYLSLCIYIYIYIYVYLCDIEFSSETVNLSFRRSHGLFEVYAPCRVQLRQWSDVAMVAVSRREAYEAAAMGPRGVCLKDQGGAMPLCLSPHRKLTWQWNITHIFVGRYIFKWLVFHCRVQFCRCKGGRWR